MYVPIHRYFVSIWLTFGRIDQNTLQVLLIVATPPESSLVRAELEISTPDPGKPVSIDWNGMQISLLHSGIGMVNTALHLGRYLDRTKPDLAIQFGIAGSFSNGPELGEVVEVNREIYGDLGAESPSGFLDLAEMGFENFRVGDELYYNEMVNPSGSQSQYRSVSGITVNRISTEGKIIAVNTFFDREALFQQLAADGAAGAAGAAAAGGKAE